MALQVWNDLTQQKEPFVPINDGQVGLYVCGPTVYDYFHIGNGRTFVVFDTIRRYLRYRGYEVTYVQNFTDVDDKVIQRAQAEGRSPEALAEEMIEAYFEDADALLIERATHHPRATAYIAEMIQMIETLIAKGHAYQAGGDVYYRVRSFPAYGNLSKRNLDELVAGARVAPGEVKEDPADFVLWKGQKLGEPSWPSPWGPGRPGWHIECSAMAKEFLGVTFDIHGGGHDLLFPHHENEVAQSEAANEAPFAKYWLHTGFLVMDGEKMSKSLGNFFTVREILKHYDGEAIRFYLLSAHYRTQLNWGEELIAQAKVGLDRLHNAIRNLQHLKSHAPADELTPDQVALLAELRYHRVRFQAAMDDDFNTADAIAVLFDLAHEVNSKVGPGRPQAFYEAIINLFAEFGGVLGLFSKILTEETLDAEIQALVEARQAARQAKNWAEADRIRDELTARGIILEDTPQGVRWKRA